MDKIDIKFSIDFSIEEFEKSTFTLDFLLLMKAKALKNKSDNYKHEEYIEAYGFILNSIDKKISKIRKEKINKLLNEK